MDPLGRPCNRNSGAHQKTNLGIEAKFVGLRPSVARRLKTSMLRLPDEILLVMTFSAVIMQVLLLHCGWMLRNLCVSEHRGDLH